MTEGNVLMAVFCRSSMGKEHLMATHDGFSRWLGIIVVINSIALFVMSLLLLFLVEKVPIGLRIGARKVALCSSTVI